MWDCWVLVTHRFYQNSCRCRGYQCKWCYRTQVGVRRGPWSLLCFVSGWSVVEPSWDDRGSSIWGYLPFLLDLAVVGLCVYSEWCMNYLSIVWSGDCKPTLFIPFLLITWDCVKMTLLGQNHNAVMPLSRASTRGRYSRIVGVTPREDRVQVSHVLDSDSDCTDIPD